MLFNSYEFIFLFLPIALSGYVAARNYNDRIASLWLFAASLFFYGWWNWKYVPLLLISITFNFGIGTRMARAARTGRQATLKNLLILGILANLALLGYYKYTNFFLTNVSTALGSNWSVSEIILPLGISFFTFTQIAFLVDAFRGEVRDYSFVRYGLFVTYFPHLIAGPILHHQEIMPQFRSGNLNTQFYRGLSIGLIIFAIGLFKKVVIADNLAAYVAPVFNPAELPNPTLIEAWCGTLAYTFQLYFDFSGYSDMAIGLSQMFGVKLPLNFYSPYKATNIIEFWRRWHMTLSRFLRDYLYFPLGGNRKGSLRRHLNLVVTMVLGGLWHGAGWTFLAWGGIHAAYLVINHGWQSLRRSLGHNPAHSTKPGRAASVFITFIAVAIAWVFFRAESIPSAIAILKGMAGLNGVVLMEQWLPKLGGLGNFLSSLGVNFGHPFYYSTFPEIKYVLVVLIAVVWFMPNAHDIMAKYEPALVPSGVVRPARRAWWNWNPGLPWALLGGAVFAYTLANITKLSEFLYFQF